MVARPRFALPLVVLVLGLLASIAAAMLIARVEDERRQERLEGLADSAVGMVEGRMLAQLTLLRGAAGLFNAEEQVTRDDFHAFVARLRLEQNYPGVLGIGYTAYLPDSASVNRLVAEARRTISPDFRVWPAGDRPAYSAILYLEPLNRRNHAAIGFDMLSEGTRRAAMEAARTSGMGHMSGRVRLVQEIDPVKQPGFLIYVPLYHGQREGLSEELDPADHYGWVYSPLRAFDLFDAVFAGKRELEAIAVEIYDGKAVPDRLLYRSGSATPNARDAVLREIEIANRKWLVRVVPSPAFAEGSPLAFASTVGAAATLISLLIAVLMAQQLRARARTEREVELRTAELRQANERMRAEAEAREEAESKIRHMQRIEAIGQLTGGIAHDFNNMLSIVIGNLDIAERRIDQPDRLRRALEGARAGADRAAELTRRLLAFGRQQPLSPRVLDPNKIVTGMSEMLRRTIGEAIRLETVLAGGVWRICADAGELENAILNLAINARDAMPDGGALTIETANCHLDEGYARDHVGVEPGQYVLIAVSDTGHGMSREVAAKALEPFFTTKEVGRGTGLGLSQVFGYVKQSGGHLKLYSEPGEGTTVKIYLPRHRGADDVVEETPVQGAAPRALTGETILVVEDEEQVRALSIEALRDLGYTVVEATNGREALDCLDAHPEVRLVFTDVVMPEMNGRRLADAARERWPDLRFVFTTGYTRNAIVHHGRLDDGVALLQKPFTTAQLAAKIRSELDR